MLQLVYEVDHVFTHGRAVYPVHKPAVLKPCVLSLEKIKTAQGARIQRQRKVTGKSGFSLFFFLCRQEKVKVAQTHTHTPTHPPLLTDSLAKNIRDLNYQKL